MTDFVMPPGRHGIERVVEYNWVLHHVKPNSTILDVGTVAPPIMSGYPEYVFNLTRRMQCQYRTMDIMPGANILADIREVRMPPKCFDYVIAISTLEHITIRPWDALANMLHIGKNVLVTMPYGLDHEMPWGFNYGKDRLERLWGKETPNLIEYYAHLPEGWTKTEAKYLETTPYGAFNSEGAGIVCFGYLEKTPEEPAS